MTARATQSDITFRFAAADDAERCGAICYEAFKAIAEQHNFPPDFPSPEIAAGLYGAMIANPGFGGTIAEAGGRIVGSIFVSERSAIAGISVVTVDPKAQNGTIGRQLMLRALEHLSETGFHGVRLIQAAYHVRSLALYAKLGFETREALSSMQGSAIGARIPGHEVRRATKDDLDACNEVSRRVHGHDRAGELADAIERGTATLVEHGGRVTGYATAIGFLDHAVADNNEGLKALIGAAEEFQGPGFLLPTGNGELLRWCMDRGLKISQQMTLMTTGLYNEPTGAYLPAVLC